MEGDTDVAASKPSVFRVVLSFVGSTFTQEPFSWNQAKLKFQRAAQVASTAIEAGGTAPVVLLKSVVVYL
jgi:hypothetical protein